MSADGARTSALSFQELTPTELQATAAPATVWLWHGYVRRGNVTLLTSPWHAGTAVLILHHPRKQASAAGQWARGSGALSGYVDILLEMHYYATADADDRRRKVLAYSRHDETPRRQVIELDSGGTDWLARGDL